MNVTLDVLAFIGGSLVWGLRSWFGKQLVNGLFWILKRTLNLSAEEIGLYMAHRNATRHKGTIRAVR